MSLNMTLCTNSIRLTNPQINHFIQNETSYICIYIHVSLYFAASIQKRRQFSNVHINMHFQYLISDICFKKFPCN